MRLPAALTAALLLSCVRVAAAQAGGGTPREALARVSGIVHDSLAGTPLAGAMVQIVASDSGRGFSRAAPSDSLGRFAIDSVPAGRYAIGFFHPMLDSLGIAAPARELLVLGAESLRVDLAIPSPARLRDALCGARPGARTKADSGGVVAGFVRDAATHAPVAGAEVVAEWLELTFTADGVQRRQPRSVSTTWPSGFFFMCDVPSPGTVAVVARRGADSTDQLELQVAERGYQRLDFFLHVTSSAAAGGDTRVAGTPGRLTGTVSSAEGARVIPNAEIRIGAEPPVRANERGEWVLSSTKAGTRMMEVRAVGYYPERRAVHLVEGGAPVRVSLNTLRAVLDTVRVRARRVVLRTHTGFAERRRTLGTGRYYTASDLAKRRLPGISDFFRRTPGMRAERSESGLSLLIRDARGDWCTPDVFIDGQLMNGLGTEADALDGWIQPGQVAGIEIHPVGHVPVEFSRGMIGETCGAVVIWTK